MVFAKLKESPCNRLTTDINIWYQNRENKGIPNTYFICIFFSLRHSIKHKTIESSLRGDII